MLKKIGEFFKKWWWLFLAIGGVVAGVLAWIFRSNWTTKLFKQQVDITSKEEDELKKLQDEQNRHAQELLKQHEQELAAIKKKYDELQEKLDKKKKDDAQHFIDKFDSDPNAATKELADLLDINFFSSN